MNTYKIINVNNYSKNRIDRNKRNILILGKAETSNKQKLILNPINPSTAKVLYGDSDLYKAYEEAYSITNDSNIYTVNCQLYTDFIELIDDIVQYNFDFIVPLDIYLRDTFVNPRSNEKQYFIAYYLDRLGYTDNNTTVIATDYKSELYESIDHYIIDMNKVYKEFSNNNALILDKYGNNLVFVLNNLINNEFSNVSLAATLSICDFVSYPENIAYATYYDIDTFDLHNKDMCFYKYHESNNQSSIEQLNNLRQVNDMPKRVLIDLLIKYVVNKLDMSEFNGVLYNPYVQLQINNRVTKILEDMNGKIFQKYKINSITFNKIDLVSGDIIIDVAIVPFGLLENINIFIEV